MSDFDRIAAFEQLPNSALLTLKEIVALSGRSKTSIWRDIESQRLPRPIAIGLNASRWRVADVRSYLKGAGA